MSAPKRDQFTVAREQGVAARETGTTREQNPYQPRNFHERALRAEWWAGWDEAGKGGESR